VPYGIKKTLGGDKPSTDAKMERCVSDLQAKGHSKMSAILICKSSIQKSLAKGKG
jgi:hypothetical protein